MKILLIRNDNLGDLICTTPAIEALRKKYPNGTIDIVVNSYNKMGIEGSPFVDTIYCYTKPKHLKGFGKKFTAFLNKTAMMLAIARQKYDAVVVMRSGYSKSASLFAKITRAKLKIGVKNPKGSDPFNRYVQAVPDSHEVEFCYECFKPLDVEPNGENTLIIPQPSLVGKYQAFQDKTVFHISSRVTENKLPYEKIHAIAQKIKSPLITYEPSDKAMAQKLQDELGIELGDTRNVDDLTALIACTKAIVTLDGGTVHIGPALGKPTVAIFGKGNVKKWYPWGYKDFCLTTQEAGLAEKVTENLQKLGV